MIQTCPNCQVQCEERDNFCIECGKNLNTLIKQSNIKNKIIEK